MPIQGKRGQQLQRWHLCQLFFGAGADDSPEESAMLQRRRDGEGREDDGEDEEVVDGQALLDEVTGEELERAPTRTRSTPRR